MATILIIDGDESVLGMIGQMLSEAGYDVQGASDGEIGLHLLDTLTFDLSGGPSNASDAAPVPSGVKRVIRFERVQKRV